jgi:hypothetical protein
MVSACPRQFLPHFINGTQNLLDRKSSGSRFYERFHRVDKGLENRFDFGTALANDDVLATPSTRFWRWRFSCRVLITVVRSFRIHVKSPGAPILKITRQIDAS